MSNIFFTADHHFGHRNIIKYSHRLEFANDTEKDIILRCSEQLKLANDIEDKTEKDIVISGIEKELQELRISDASIECMNNGLIERWNSVVKKGDLVYHLGDMFLCEIFEAEWILKELNGEIHYIEGNHDKVANQIRSQFASYAKYREIKLDDSSASNGRRSITLCHYAARVWNKSHHGAWMLYGHSHGSLTDNPNAMSFDVGVDCHDYTPISYEQVKEIMKTKTFVPIDHHTGK